MPNMINSFLNPDRAYKKAQDVSRRSWEEAKKYEVPFWQQGLDQYGRLNEATGKLLDPAALESEWAKGYEMSPYAKIQLEQNKNLGLDAASSMGLMGSSAALGNIQTGAGNVVAQDRQNYLKDLMDKYLAGIGLGKDIYNTGAGMGATLGGQSLQQGQDQAALEANKQMAPGQLFEKLLGSGLDIFSNWASGGFDRAYTG